MTDDVVTGVACGECKGPIEGGRAAMEAPREPCPACGSTVRIVGVHTSATVTAHAELHLTGYRESKSKWFVKVKQVRSWFRRDGVWHRVDRTLNKRENRYVEHIVDEETGAVVRHVEEKLTDHQGHGSAKRKS